MKFPILLGGIVITSIFLVTPTNVYAVVQNLNGQTGQTQTFNNDANVTISSSNNIHSIIWQGLLPLSRGGTGSSSFLNGSIPFIFNGVFSEDNSNLFWDNSNKRLGIGNSSPTSTLDVSGNVTAQSLISSSDSTIHTLTIGLGGGSASSNTAIGKDALLNANSNSYGNTAIGFMSFRNAGSSGDSTAIGAYALAETISGDADTAIGSNALSHNTTGRYNTAVGGGTLVLNETGEKNTALGNSALAYTVYNYKNIGIGFRAGCYQADESYLTSAQRSIYIGSEARGYDNNDYNSIVIGDSAIGAGAYTAVFGDAGIGRVYFGSSSGLANIYATKIFLGSSARPGCIIMGDSDGDGITYLTVNDGVISTSITRPSACE